MFLFGSQHCFRARAVEEEYSFEFMRQDGAGFQTGAMGHPQPGDIKVPQCFDCFIHLRFVSADEVRAADNSVDLLNARNFLCMQDSIDQTPVAAAKKNN